MTQKRRQTHQQLQKKIQQRQQRQQIQQTNGNSVVPQSPVALVTQPHTVMVHSQTKSQVRILNFIGTSDTYTVLFDTYNPDLTNILNFDKTKKQTNENSSDKYIFVGKS